MPTIRSNEPLWQRIKQSVIRESVGGTAAGQWSARKALIAVKRYKAAGGRYVGPRDSRNSLTRWVRQDWRTASGRPSHITGERYLPRKAFKALSASELRSINRSKKLAMSRGIQFSRMPRSISRKVKKYRQ
jgi:hypothetical protein